MTCTQGMKMFRSTAFVVAFLVGSGLGEEITTERDGDIIDEVHDIATNNPLEIATHNGNKDFEVTIEPFLTEKHIDDFSVVVIRNDQDTKCKCRRRRKICENGEKPTFKQNRATCSDGSRPRCPDDLCPSGEVISDKDNIENKKKCKCPRRRKICENGEKPNFQKNQPRCNDGSKPRCPAKRCSNPNQFFVEISSVTQETTTNNDIFNTISDFSTDKHVDPLVTRNPNDEPFLLVELATATPEPLIEVTPPEFSTEKHVDPFPEIVSVNEDQFEELFEVNPPEFSTEKHVDPFPELANINEDSSIPELEIVPTEEDRVFPALFNEKDDIDVSETTQCSQDGVVACTGVRLNTDLLPSLKEGSVVMMLPGKDFTMELQRFALSKTRSTSYHFILSTGGSATMTVGENEDPEIEPSVYATIRTHGKWMYFVESCGEDCTVILTRDSNYFNNFED